MAVATVLHPSRETSATILETEVRLVAAHVLFTLSYLLVLLGLPGLYGAYSVRMGRLGLVGFLLAFMGTMLVAVSGNFGFLAPVLAAESPATIDAINLYPPEVALDAVAFVGFVVGDPASLLGFSCRRGGPDPSIRTRSRPDRLTDSVELCHPWERGSRRRPCLAWVSTVAEAGVLTRDRPPQMPMSSLNSAARTSWVAVSLRATASYRDVFALASAFAVEVDECHAFLLLGWEPHGVRAAALARDRKLPAAAPKLPETIDGLWLASLSETARVLGYVPHRGWFEGRRRPKDLES
jgi:hypothetical protein